MTTRTCQRNQLWNSELAQVIEPLADYICAADQPKVVLASALAALFREVEQTHQAAVAHFGAVVEGR